MVYSASANINAQNGGSPFGYFIKQLSFALIGFILVMIVTSLNIKKLRSPMLLKVFGIILGIILLYLLFFGSKINGAAGWVHVGGLSIQPSEFTKFYLIILLADAITKNQSTLLDSPKSWWKEMEKPLIITIVIIGLIFLQPDTGGAAINFMIVFIMLMASGFSSKKALAGISAFFVAMIFLIYKVLPLLSGIKRFANSYQFQRIIAFTQPFSHAKTSGTQLVNSYYAISNGGLFGVGLGNSVQKTGYLPEPNTDFIMAVLTEELGAIGTFCVIVLLAIIILRTIQLGVKVDDPYQSLICYGVATYLTIQALFNFGGVVGLLPITGVTFPFISYGGSSMFALALCIGLVLNISRRHSEIPLLNSAASEEVK